MGSVHSINKTFISGVSQAVLSVDDKVSKFINTSSNSMDGSTSNILSVYSFNSLRLSRISVFLSCYISLHT